MTSSPAIPPDLMREPWWPRVEHQTLAQVLRQLSASDRDAAMFIALDRLAQKGMPLPPHRRELALTFIHQETLGDWVRQWTGSASHERAEGGLAAALQALARVLVRSAPAPTMTVVQVATPAETSSAPLDELGPLAQMDVEVLDERAARANLPNRPYLRTQGPMSLAGYLRSGWPATAEGKRWLRERVAAHLADIAREAPWREELRAAWHMAAKGEAASALLALRGRLSVSTTPVTQELLASAKPEWNRATDQIRVESRALFACLTGHCGFVTLDLAGEVPSALCERGDRPCRLKLLAVERVLLTLTQPADERERALAEHLLQPAWRRQLVRLRSIGGEAEGPRRFGWLLKSSDELVPVWLEGKRGGGWKAKALTTTEAHELGPEDAADVAVMALKPWGSTPSYQTAHQRASLVARALAALVGREHVFARADGELGPVRVERVSPQVEVEPTPDGPRLCVRWGDRVETTTRREPPSPGNWEIHEDLSHSLVRVGMWSRAACDAWQALRHATPVPVEATTELAEALLEVSDRVSVKRDPSWLGDAHAPADDHVYRLGFAGARAARVLDVEARVQPVPELGVMRPDHGEEVIPVRRHGRVGHVTRDFARERASATALAASLGLEMREPVIFDWHIDGLEASLTLLAALEARAADGHPPLRIEWKTQRPQVLARRTAKELRLRLGVRRDWLDIDGGFALDGGELPLLELLQALRDKKRFVAVDETRVLEIGEALAKELTPLAALARERDRSRERAGLQASVLAAPLLAELESAGAHIEGPPEWLLASRRLREAERLEVAVPEDLVADLRPYQKEGLTWLARLAHWARGACLADDMGLGKTLQALALLLHRRELGPALVVAPTSVVTNWLREAERFAPTLRVVGIVKGLSLSQAEADGVDVVVTTWDLLVRHEERLGRRAWATIVLDEAHAIKNAATRRAQVARALATKRLGAFVVALTGTPVENRPSELWSLFQVVAPGLLGSADAFREGYARQIEQGDGEAARRLARLVRPFLLRRRKAEVEVDLPPRTEVRVDVVLSATERSHYEEVRKSALANLVAHGFDAIAEGRGILQVLVVLTRLRQMACHPRLVLPEAGPSSAKLERLVELVAELRDEGRKVLVFSQFTELLVLVRAAFDAAGFSYAYLDGSTPPERRVREVDRFQAGEVDAFLLSLKAGGVGLNLTTASEVIHLDPWWNPAVEDQATDRAHRIGQDKPVTIYRLVAQGTIEEQILKLHGDKRRMVASLLEGTASAAPVSVDELMALLSEDGLEASAPEPATADASEPEPAPTRLPPVASALERTLMVLRRESDKWLKRGELIHLANLGEREWPAVRAGLDAEAQVAVQGLARARAYRWIGPV